MQNVDLVVCVQDDAETSPGPLRVLEEASRLLEKARTLEDVKSVRDKAEAARSYAKAASLGMELQNLAAELKLRAERKAGDFLGCLGLRGGNRRSDFPHPSLKLEDFGITKHQSARWQLEAAVPEEDFEAYLDERRDAGREITSAGLMRVASRARARGCSPSQSRPGPVIDQASDQQAVAQLFTAARELIDELRHHHSGLAVVLQPLIDGEGDLGVTNKRMARYLLGQLSRVLEELAEMAD